MTALTRWVLAHKLIVVITWVLLTVAGMAAAGPASEALEAEFSVPEEEGWETNQAIAAQYNGTGGDTSPLLPVVTLPEGESIDSPQVKADLAELDKRLADALPGSRVASYASTGDEAFVSNDGTTTFALVYPKPDPTSVFGENPAAEKAASEALEGTTVAGEPVLLSGFDALFEDSGAEQEGSVLVEAVIGGVGALLVLAFVFASLLAFVPLGMAIVSIMTTFLLLLGLTELTSVSPIVQFLIALIGLGVAIDYSLIVATRWREERAHGHEGDEAVQRAMETAGRAVVFSGITVGIGLFALIALPLPFLRSMGYGGMLIPLVIDPGGDHAAAGRAREGRQPARLAPPAHRRQGVAGLDPLGRGGLPSPLGCGRRRNGGGRSVSCSPRPTSSSAPRTRTPRRSPVMRRTGLDALQSSGIGEGALLPHEILIEGDTDPEAVAAGMREIDGIHGAVAPEDESWRQGGTAIVDAIPIDDSGSAEGEETLTAVRETAAAAGDDVRVGGQPASNDDFIDAVYGSFPLMVALITITTFILLARAFRSLLLPLKAIDPQHPQFAAAYGRAGAGLAGGLRLRGDLRDRGDRGGARRAMPMMIFAFLFGLSMDYEVFILSRMREEYDKTGSTDTAVIRGIARTGTAGDERGADPVPGVRRDGVRAGDTT